MGLWCHERIYLVNMSWFWNCCTPSSGQDYLCVGRWDAEADNSLLHNFVLGMNIACSWLWAPVWIEERNTKLCRKVALVIRSVVKIGRDFWRSSGPTCLLKQSYLRALGTGLCCDSIWISPRLETPLPPWATSVSAWSLSKGKNVPGCSEGTACVSVCAHHSGPV